MTTKKKKKTTTENILLIHFHVFTATNPRHGTECVRRHKTHESYTLGKTEKKKTQTESQTEKEKKPMKLCIL